MTQEIAISHGCIECIPCYHNCIINGQSSELDADEIWKWGETNGFPDILVYPGENGPPVKWSHFEP